MFLFSQVLLITELSLEDFRNGGHRRHGNQRELVEVRRLAKERRHAIDTARGGKSSSH